MMGRLRRPSWMCVVQSWAGQFVFRCVAQAALPANMSNDFADTSPSSCSGPPLGLYGFLKGAKVPASEHCQLLHFDITFLRKIMFSCQDFTKEDSFASIESGMLCVG